MKQDVFLQAKIGVLKNRIRKRHFRELASFVGDDKVTLYGLKDFGTAFSWDMASYLIENGYDVFDHVTLRLYPKHTHEGKEMEIHGMAKPYIQGNKLLFFIYQSPADDAPYLYARRIGGYESVGVKPLDSRVVVADDFQMLDNETIFRDKFLRALNDDHGMSRMRLGDVGPSVSREIRMAGQEIKKYLAGNGCLIELPGGTYPAIGAGLFLLGQGEMPVYVNVASGSDLIGEEWHSEDIEGRNVLVFNGNLNPSQEDLDLFKDFGATNVKSFGEFVSQSI